MRTTLLVWCTIIATDRHVSSINPWKICTSYCLAVASLRSPAARPRHPADTHISLSYLLHSKQGSSLPATWPLTNILASRQCFSKVRRLATFFLNNLASNRKQGHQLFLPPLCHILSLYSTPGRSLLVKLRRGVDHQLTVKDARYMYLANLNINNWACTLFGAISPNLLMNATVCLPPLLTCVIWRHAYIRSLATRIHSP